MPRQPFAPIRRKYPGGNIQIGASAIGQLPEFETVIAQCLMSWPVVESEMALLLGQLLGINSEAALAVFETLRRSTAQRDAISAAAAIVLDSQDLELLTAMLDVHKSIEAERNSLAHGHFGIFDKKPDILLWITARDYILLKAKLHLAHVVATTALMDDFASRLSFFRLDDLRKIFESIDYCGHMWPMGVNWLRTRQPQRDQLFRQLCDQPRIAQALATLRQKNSPATPPQSPPPVGGGTA
jgi:hypothetical protein